MHQHLSAPPTRLLALVICPLLPFAGCAQNSAPPDPHVKVSYSPVSESDGPNAIFEEARESHQANIDFIASGNCNEAEQQSRQTTAALQGAVTECLDRADCGIVTILATVETLIAASNEALEAQAERIHSLERAADLRGEVESVEAGFASAYPDEHNGGAPLTLEEGEVAEWLTLNGPVKAEIDDWLTWRRPLLMETWDNYQFLRPKMAPIYEEAGLPEALLFAMLATETGGKVHSQSRAGAAGPLQFMSSTGRRYGLGVVDGFDQRLDPEASTRANVAYMQEQLNRFDRNVEKALAAYNGGENRMRGLHRRTGGASLWDSRVYWSLPRETRDYVPRILAAARIFEHPEQYNVEFPRPPMDTTQLRLERETAIDELAVCIGQAGNRPGGWFRALRNLNPRYGPGEPLPAGTTIVIPTGVESAYRALCQSGDLATLARDLREANYPPQPPLIVYTVRRGDTLSRIASRHRCASVREISSLNGIRGPNYVIRIGQHIKVPTCS